MVNHTIYYIVCKPLTQAQDSLAKCCFDDRTFERSQSKYLFMQNLMKLKRDLKLMNNITRENSCNLWAESLSILLTFLLTDCLKKLVFLTRVERSSRNRWKPSVKKVRLSFKVAFPTPQKKNQSFSPKLWEKLLVSVILRSQQLYKEKLL